MENEFKKEAVNAFKEKYGELPADAGFPVIRVCKDAVYFARDLDDWHDYAKDQKFLGKLITFVMTAIFSIILLVVIDLIFISNHQLLFFALAAYAILLIFIGFVIACRPPRKTSIRNREILFYDKYKTKIYIVAL